MLISFMMVLAGLLLLTFAGDYLVRSALAISKRFNVSAFFTGVVVVGFGTSAPELLVSLSAAVADQPDIAMGNVVGSNIANVLLILGFSGILAPIACSDKAVRREALACLMASFILLGFAYIGVISRLAGGLFLATFVLYLTLVARADKNTGNQGSQEVTENWSFRISALIGFASAITLALGAELLVIGASDIARTIGISDRIIGLTLIAVGTSLPEFVAAVMAAARRQTSLIIGNVLGSTLFNIFSILGITALVVPLNIAPEMTSTDIPISIGTIALLTAVVVVSKFINKLVGFMMVAFYVSYIVILFA